MRSFFVQMFLAFWVSTLAIIIATTTIFPRKDFAYPENTITALLRSTGNLAHLKLTEAKTNGCIADAGPSRMLVLDGKNSDVCGRAVPGEIKNLAARVREGGRRNFAKAGSFWMVGQAVSGDHGERYVGVFLTPFQKAPWFPPLPRSALPVSALVTFLFAYLLTNPVRALREAFRKFASGDLSVRLPVVRSAFRDWGGADIRRLMTDFNDMADRIGALLIAHKTLLRDVSHELRSPLARLNVALELAREDAREATDTLDRIDALDRAELESSRLNTLIGELLSLSRMETVQDVPPFHPVNLGSLVDDLMPDLLFEAQARGCSLTHNRKSEANVAGNEELLRRALENVIRNAIRYSPQGGTVEIETANEEPNHAGSGTVVRICDRGPGVPEQSLRSIFHPFYRVDTARQQSTGGFGVGLAIADRAVAIHHGIIQAHNRPGGGLCVEMNFTCPHTSEKSSQV